MTETTETKTEQEQEQEQEESSTLPDDPSLLRAEIAKLRRENAGHRTKNKSLQEAADKLAEIEDSTKSETEKATAAAAAAEQRATAAELEAARLRVAVTKGLTAGQARRLVGTTEDELSSDADEMLSEIKGSGHPTPRERLRSGMNVTDEAGETDPRKLAESVPRL